MIVRSGRWSRISCRRFTPRNRARLSSARAIGASPIGAKGEFDAAAAPLAGANAKPAAVAAIAATLAAPEERERGAGRRLREIGNLRVARRVRPDAYHARPRHRTECAKIGIVAIHHDAAIVRDDAHEMGKRALHVGEVAKNIRVIELEVVEHGNTRRVVNELAPLVEEGAVVFVAFDHERIGGTAEVRTNGRVLWHAANQKSRIALRGPQQVSRERRGRRFPVRAAHHDVAPRSQHEIVQQCRQGRERDDSRVEQPLDFRIAPGHRIADHDQVGRQPLQADRIVALVKLNPRGREHRAHRRIDAAVGTKDLVAGGAREQGGIPHRGAANSHEIDLHPEREGGRAEIDGDHKT